MLPPTDISARSLFLKLTERPAPSVVIPFPRNGEDGKPVGSVRIVVWNQEAHVRARESAVERLRSKDLSSDKITTGRDLEEDFVAQELVALTCCEVEPTELPDGKRTYRQIFRGGDDVAGAVTSDELHVLFTAYMLAKRQFGPYAASFQSDSEVNLWIDRLRDGAATLPLLSALASHQLAELTLSLARRVSIFSSCLSGPPESLPTRLALIPATWIIATSSYTAPAASATPSPDIASTDLPDLAESMLPKS